ncbi:MAG: bifunctional riboflavin kinase/FAD synthetase [Gammaproteobacteria bacterium]|nr:bifunctional riboflavin kinase/FAD synthetase [Gammaproteobacteria bacterium]
MDVIRGLHNIRAGHRGAALSIGNYDGVHLGHLAVLDLLKQQAAELNVPSMAMVFEPQSAEFFKGEKAPARLTRLREKIERLGDADIDLLLVQRFDDALTSLAASAFVESVLIERLGARSIIVGDDFRFGRDRAGDYALLDRFSRQYGFALTRSPSIRIDGERVSSTAIRTYLAAGDLDRAAKLLGRPYTMSGYVQHGRKLGRELGFPTLNISPKRRSSPLQGIFAMRVSGLVDVPLEGVGYIGKRPTVVDQHTVNKEVLEVNLFDWNQECYGYHVQVEFVAKLRDDVAFPSQEALREQIAIDVSSARAVFAGRGEPA